jgi:carbamoyltransferase
MSIVLGIHIGHHASCAVVKDGHLIAAIQLERLSGQKSHTVLILSNELPVAEVLSACGLTLSDVDLIVSSFQATARAGFGLHQPLIAHDFHLFDPFEIRHHVVSHHLAHAHSAIAYAPPGRLAVLISDYAGSSTTDGKDFAQPFSEWYASLIGDRDTIALQTECLSIYASDHNKLILKYREYRVPHVAPDSAVCSVASLYENVTGAVLPGHNQHGSLMALAAYGEFHDDADDPGPLIEVNGDHVSYRNDWQHKVYSDYIAPLNADREGIETSKAARLAWLCQKATESALLAYARQAKSLCRCDVLAVAGGTFLNILANSRISNEALFESMHVPSAPNDAGISIGCAIWGALKAGDEIHQIFNDRLGPIHDTSIAAQQFSGLVEKTKVSVKSIAERLAQGEILARFSGRSEFGPRALGGRSLLASPLIMTNKTRLNNIKGRQHWRPVAPIVSMHNFERFFEGPANSYWMSFAHYIRLPHALNLPALQHPDGSTRCQCLNRNQDEWLDQLLEEFGKLTGYPILLNTSLNGPEEPILEQPFAAVHWFLMHRDVDALLLDEILITRKPVDVFFRSGVWSLGPNVYRMFSPSSPSSEVSSVVLKGTGGVHFIRSSSLAYAIVCNQQLVYPELEMESDHDVKQEWTELFLKRLIVKEGDEV